jgi:large subunit ribosomal protein L9
MSIWSKTCEAFIKNSTFLQQFRTTYIVKRKWDPPPASTVRQLKLRRKHRIYETVQDHEPPAEPRQVQLLLQKYVGDLGRPGDVVTVPDKKARLHLLNLSAVYATPENLAKVASLQKEASFSSKYAGATLMELSRFILDVTMNKEEPWTLEPWHIRAAFRKAYVCVPEEAITMPKKPISGPNPDLQDKEFYVTVTINDKETVPVRCRIHHWATELDERLPPFKEHRLYPAKPIFAEDEEFAKTLPEIVPPPAL